MVVIAIIIVSIILMTIFVAVTVAGGKSHDRANEISAQRASEIDNEASADQDQHNG